MTHDEIKNNCELCFLFVVFIFMLFMIKKSNINKLVCILFVHISSISLENLKDRSLTSPEIFELIKLHTYKFGLVYLDLNIQLILAIVIFMSILTFMLSRVKHEKVL